MRIVVLILALLCVVNCSTQGHNTDTLYRPYRGNDSKNVWVVNYSWHSGIIIRAADIPASLIPEKEDFPNAEFLEIGWGNKAFYQAPEFKLSLAAKALFIPGQSTMAVHGFSHSPEREFSDSKITALHFSPEQFYRIVEAMDQSFDRKGQVRTRPALKDMKDDSYFYDAYGSYSMIRTCNNWTAKILYQGGVPVSTSLYSATANHVMSQVGHYGIVVRANNKDPVGSE